MYFQNVYPNIRTTYETPCIGFSIVFTKIIQTIVEKSGINYYFL